MQSIGPSVKISKFSNIFIQFSIKTDSDWAGFIGVLTRRSARPSRWRQFTWTKKLKYVKKIAFLHVRFNELHFSRLEKIHPVEI